MQQITTLLQLVLAVQAMVQIQLFQKLQQLVVVVLVAVLVVAVLVRMAEPLPQQILREGRVLRFKA
jgi:hypothetical protein